MFDRNLMKLSGMPAIMAALLLLALMQAAAIIVQAFMLSSAISMLWSGAEIGECSMQIAAFFASFACLQLIRFAQEALLDSHSQKCAGELQRQLLEATFDGQQLLARNVGAAFTSVSILEGIDEIQTYIRLIPPKIIGMAAISLPLLVAAWIADWPTGIILAVMFPVIIFFMILLGKQARAQSERQYAVYTRLQNNFMDTLRGIRTIAAFGAGEREGNRAFSLSERLRSATIRTLTTATLSSAVLDLCATFGVAAVAMMLAFRLMDGSISLQTGLMALILAPEYFLPIRSFASDFHASLDGKNALSSVLDMTSRASLVEGANNAVPIASWSCDTTLDMNGIGFSHTGSGAGIRDINLTFSGFRKYAIVGASGAGKTTLANIIAGLTSPNSGSVLINGCETDLTSSEWKRQVRYIPQNPYVFSASIADNVSFYNPNATTAEISAALEAVGLGEFVRECSDGIDTIIGEGQRSLSGGQAHRIALARVLVDPTAHVLVFDEPTAHLDIETELELKQHMLKAMEGKLVVFATHRRHWIADMDTVVELSEGTVKSVEEVSA